MNNNACELEAVERVEANLVDDTPYFAPVDTDLIDGLVGQYQRARAQIAEVAGFTKTEAHKAVIHYFLEGNADENRGRSSLNYSAAQLFDEAGAVGALNSAYWSKALALTDVLDMMPQKRRDEWHESIRLQKAPDFEEATVRSTLTELLNMRAQFLAERVDGIFRGLSGEHVTNAPEAFGKRMIVARVLTSYDTIEHSTAGRINDLRAVIAKFMGRDEPKFDASSGLLRALKGRWGEWVTVDGGALRIRLYKKGTAHMEVHPDMAWRLNQILAHLYPLAIPAQFRQKPKRRSKEFQMVGRPLPFWVLSCLQGMEQARERVGDDWRGNYRRIPNTLKFSASTGDCDQAAAVLRAIGGIPVKTYFQFDYDPSDVLAEILASGCIPDQRAHQYYPTPDKLATIVAELADIGEDHSVLEPSAGQGHIAAQLPKERTTCVEISGLHCDILRAKGYSVEQGDFIAWADNAAARFDRVVMNPPFSEGRAVLHVERAASLVKPGGRLVAIMPSGMRGKDFLPGFDATWSSVYDNEFAGTSVSVVILCADRRA